MYQFDREYRVQTRSLPSAIRDLQDRSKLNPTIKISLTSLYKIELKSENEPLQVFIESARSDISRFSDCYSNTQLAPVQILHFQPKSNCLDDE